MTPIEASKKVNEDEVFFNLSDKRKKKKPKYKVNDIVRTLNKRNIFSKFDSTNWSYNLYKITEVLDDTIPSYKLKKISRKVYRSLITKIKTISC